MVILLMWIGCGFGTWKRIFEVLSKTIVSGRMRLLLFLKQGSSCIKRNVMCTVVKFSGEVRCNNDGSKVRKRNRRPGRDIMHRAS